MVSKFSILFILCVFKIAHFQESAPKKTSGAETILNALIPTLSQKYCLSTVEEHWLSQVLDAVKVLNESLSSVDTTKEEIVAAITTQLTETKELIVRETQNLISDSEKIILDQLTIVKDTIKEEILVEITAQLAETKESIVDETQKLISDSDTIVLDQLTTVKDAIVLENQNLAATVEENLKNELATIEDNLTAELNDTKHLQLENKEVVDDIQLRNPLPTDCRDLQARGATASGTYRIKPRAATSDFLVYCDFTTEDGGWTYVVNRIDGSQDFFLGWNDYRLGFGKVSGEHWLGLEHLYALTNSEPYELLFQLVDGNLETFYAKYDNFKIGPESDGYPITGLGTYSGDAQDSFSYHRGVKFSTKDNDLDEHTDECATKWTGAWWYKNCIASSQLTGTHKTGETNTLIWTYISTIDEARMMIRPRNN